jgi:4-amino-4-deoxy-L-arabinose transferase-like glycosyltransferase
MKSPCVTSLKTSLGQAPIWILFILVLVTIGNLVSVFAIDVHPDEAYYWAWSIYPDIGYLDHPPMVGWMIWLVNKLFGITNFTLRLPALLSWIVAVVCVYKISSKHYGEPLYGWLAAAVLSILPVFQAASHIITPDTPLLLFTVLVYYFLFDAVSTDSPRAWVLAGAMTGLGLLSKYNAVLLPVTIFLGLLVTKAGRKKLARFSPWLASIIAALLFLPVVYWNYQNDWASFSLQIGHGVGAKFKLANIGVYIGGQLGAALIWIMLMMAMATFKRFQARTGDSENSQVFQNILVTGFWLPLAFFGWASGTTVGQVNWPAMAYFPGSILLAGMLGSYMHAGMEKRKSRANLVVASLLVFSCLFSITLVNIFRFPIEAKRIGLGILPTNTQLSDTYGWTQLKNRIEEISQRNHLGADCRIYLSTKYMWSSMIYRFRDVERFAILPGRTHNQYANWASRGFFDKRKPCMVVERLPLDRSAYPIAKEWPGLGKWKLVDKLVTPTSDTPRIYGFYLPIK